MKKTAVGSLAVLVLIGYSVCVYYLSDSYSERLIEDYGFYAGLTIEHVREFAGGFRY